MSRNGNVSTHLLTEQVFVKFTGEHSRVSSLAKAHAKVSHRDVIYAEVSNMTLAPSRLIAEILMMAFMTQFCWLAENLPILFEPFSMKVPPTMEATLVHYMRSSETLLLVTSFWW
jgi:hypothetical protein